MLLVNIMVLTTLGWEDTTAIDAAQNKDELREVDQGAERWETRMSTMI